MNYYVNEIDFVGNGSFKQFDEEVWDFGVHEIKTPHGNLKILDAIFVEQGPHVGVQFTVKGELTLNDFTCSQGFERSAKIKTFALVRQPHNVWLWVYAFDANNQPVVNFCGHDDLDGLAIYVDDLKEIY